MLRTRPAYRVRNRICFSRFQSRQKTLQTHTHKKTPAQLKRQQKLKSTTNKGLHIVDTMNNVAKRRALNVSLIDYGMALIVAYTVQHCM